MWQDDGKVQEVCPGSPREPHAPASPSVSNRIYLRSCFAHVALLDSEPWGHSNQILLILPCRQWWFLHYMNSPKMSGLWNKKKISFPLLCDENLTEDKARWERRGMLAVCRGREVMPGLLLGRVRILSHCQGLLFLEESDPLWSSQGSECEQLLHPSGSWSRIYMGWLAWGILNFLLVDKSLFSLSLMLFRSLLIWQNKRGRERSLDA